MPKLSKTRDQTLKTQGRYHLPLPTGRYQKIGCRDLMVGLARKSGVLVRLFYPAKFDKSKPNEQMNPLLWPNWLPHQAYMQGFTDVANVQNRFLLKLITTKNENAFIPAIPNAKPHQLEKGQKYPVIIFSHGLGGCRTTYSAICIELASQGFVVAALEHRDNSACLSFYPRRATYSFKSSNPDFFNIAKDEVDADDETDFGLDEVDDPNYVPPKTLAALTIVPHLELAWIRYRPVSPFRTDKPALAFRKKQINQRVRECTRALDLIEALNAGYEINNLLDPGYNHREFDNMLDMDRIIMMGHSFGGSTALLAGASELRFKSIISLDPWMFPLKDEALDLIPQPVLMIFSENLAVEKNIKDLEDWIRSSSNDGEDERKALLIKGSNHLQQSDMPYVFKGINMLSWFQLRNRISPFVVHDLTTNLSLEFIAKHLNVPIDDRIAQYVQEQKKKIRPLFK